MRRRTLLEGMASLCTELARMANLERTKIIKIQIRRHSVMEKMFLYMATQFLINMTDFSRFCARFIPHINVMVNEGFFYPRGEKSINKHFRTSSIHS